jgi:hypothetical protein
MKIMINDSRKIYTIQEEFNTLFPYLKIEFFSKPHKEGGASPKRLVHNNRKTIGECRTVHKNGTVTIIPNITVSELEQNFNDVYGLSAQVFRQSGNIWLETTVTDGWTLEQQNNQGKELSHKLVT